MTSQNTSPAVWWSPTEGVLAGENAREYVWPDELPADAVRLVPVAERCDEVISGLFGQPIGPCIRTGEHKVHGDSRGQTWWTTKADEAAAAVPDTGQAREPHIVEYAMRLIDGAVRGLPDDTDDRVLGHLALATATLRGLLAEPPGDTVQAPDVEACGSVWCVGRCVPGQLCPEPPDVAEQVAAIVAADRSVQAPDMAVPADAFRQAIIAVVGPGEWTTDHDLILALHQWAEDQATEAVVRQARLKGMTVEDGIAELGIESPRELVIAWVWAAREMLGEAPNYSETRIDFPKAEMEVKAGGEVDRYVFTVQRAGKVTPHEARQTAEADRDAALAEVARLRALLSTGTDRS